jgi:hypothetical protein
MSTSQLLAYLLDGQPHALAAPLERWLASTRFRAFADAYRPKIRKKIRGTRDAESVLDLCFELETAYLLVQERRFAVAYEHYGADRARGPDFTITYGSLTFNVEVTRQRAAPPDREASREPGGASSLRLTDTVSTKLRQLPAGVANLLVIVADDSTVDRADLPAGLRHLVSQIEQRDPASLARHRFRDPADFFRSYRRLSAVLLRGPWGDTAHRPFVFWPNPQAKHPLPSHLRTRLARWPDLSGTGAT